MEAKKFPDVASSLGPVVVRGPGGEVHRWTVLAASDSRERWVGLLTGTVMSPWINKSLQLHILKMSMIPHVFPKVMF
jgi:hypothetical protein